MSDEIILTDAAFDKEVLDSEIPVLVDFWAPWCGPCKMLAPIIEEIAKEFKGSIKVCKMNVDENQEKPNTYAIRSIPTIILFNKGKVIKQIVGFQSKDTLIEMIKDIV